MNPKITDLIQDAPKRKKNQTSNVTISLTFTAQ